MTADSPFAPSPSWSHLDHSQHLRSAHTADGVQDLCGCVVVMLRLWTPGGFVSVKVLYFVSWLACLGTLIVLCVRIGIAFNGYGAVSLLQ